MVGEGAELVGLGINDPLTGEGTSCYCARENSDRSEHKPVKLLLESACF